jgi:hypothetical protein
MTIWPFVETLVFIASKLASYISIINIESGRAYDLRRQPVRRKLESEMEAESSILEAEFTETRQHSEACIRLYVLA